MSDAGYKDRTEINIYTKVLEAEKFLVAERCQTIADVAQLENAAMANFDNFKMQIPMPYAKPTVPRPGEATVDEAVVRWKKDCSRFRDWVHKPASNGTVGLVDEKFTIETEVPATSQFYLQVYTETVLATGKAPKTGVKTKLREIKWKQVNRKNMVPTKSLSSVKAGSVDLWYCPGQRPFAKTSTLKTCNHKKFGITYAVSDLVANQMLLGKFVFWLEEQHAKSTGEKTFYTVAGPIPAEIRNTVVSLADCADPVTAKAYESFSRFVDARDAPIVRDRTDGVSYFQFNKCSTYDSHTEAVLAALNPGSTNNVKVNRFRAKYSDDEPLIYPAWGKLITPTQMCLAGKLRVSATSLDSRRAGVGASNRHVYAFFRDPEPAKRVWYLVDPWKQPGYENVANSAKKARDLQFFDSMGKGFREKGYDLVMLPAVKAQGAEGACALIGLMRALMAADGAQRGLPLNSLIDFVTGINPVTKVRNPERFLRDSKCFALFSLLLHRIFEPYIRGKNPVKKKKN